MMSRKAFDDYSLHYFELVKISSSWTQITVMAIVQPFCFRINNHLNNIHVCTQNVVVYYLVLPLSLI